MNGIIHNVSHPQDDSASYRIAEEQIFIGVFAYISHLFSVIKPQKVFFLAIDGVAPRAKMNQQRSRRFRTAKEMKEVVDKAKAKGEIIPEGDGFDSNCITPGTPFMARLSAQLKYFIAKKVSEDSDWRGVEIILSGHEVGRPAMYYCAAGDSSDQHVEILYRCLEKESTRLWSTFDSRKLSLDTMPTFDTVSTVSMPTLSCWDFSVTTLISACYERR